MIEQQDAAPARGAAGRGQSKKDVQRRQANLLKSQCPCINYAVKSLYTTCASIRLLTICNSKLNVLVSFMLVNSLSTDTLNPKP
jgi:hypothetical protein